MLFHWNYLQIRVQKTLVINNKKITQKKKKIDKINNNFSFDDVNFTQIKELSLSLNDKLNSLKNLKMSLEKYNCFLLNNFFLLLNRKNIEQGIDEKTENVVGILCIEKENEILKELFQNEKRELTIYVNIFFLLIINSSIFYYLI